MISWFKAGGLCAAGLLISLLACFGCTLHHHVPSFLDSTDPTEIFIKEVPFYPQDKYQCGPATLAMLLGWSGLSVQPEDLTSEVYSPKLRGSLQSSLVSAARNHDRVAYPITGPEELFVELEAGHPVIILQNLGLSWYPKWHYAVVVGYEKSGENIILHTGKTAEERLAWRVFRNTWKRSNYWGLLVLPPEEMPATVREKEYIAAISGLERAGHFESALKGYQLALEKWPLGLAAMMGVGNSNYAMGNFHAAANAFQKAASQFPTNGIPFNNLAQTYLMMGDTENARKAAQKAVELGGPLKGTFEDTLKEVE
jgi:hypothetical protein